MTIKTLIKRLSKWPEHYKVEDERWRPVASVELSRSGGGKGSVWIRFKKINCKSCKQEIK